jgi:hypothetical protein
MFGLVPMLRMATEHHNDVLKRSCFPFGVHCPIQQGGLIRFRATRNALSDVIKIKIDRFSQNVGFWIFRSIFTLRFADRLNNHWHRKA